MGRKNHARAMESMSASLEAEQKAKGEALRVKKALEGEINELEIGLDHANKANSEGLKSIKRYQGQLRETIQLYEDEARSRSQINEQVGISERKAAALSGEVEESKALLDSADRAKRQLDLEIADGRNAVNNMQVINGRDMTAKRGLEGSIHTIQAEVDAMLQAAENAEEKSKKAMVDAARLADELRAEQDHAAAQASAKQSLANELAQLEGRLSDAEAAAARGGKAAMAKLESKIRDLEAELANTQARTGNLLRLTSVLNASARSSCSLPVRTRRTRIVCPTLPLGSSQRSRLTSSRLRRLRRSLPSISPSSGRPSRSWKRPRREPSLLPSSKHQTSERAVKIRRKSVRVQQKQITTFTPE